MFGSSDKVPDIVDHAGIISRQHTDTVFTKARAACAKTKTLAILLETSPEESLARRREQLPALAPILETMEFIPAKKTAGRLPSDAHRNRPHLVVGHRGHNPLKGDVNSEQTEAKVVVPRDSISVRAEMDPEFLQAETQRMQDLQFEKTLDSLLALAKGFFDHLDDSSGYIGGNHLNDILSWLTGALNVRVKQRTAKQCTSLTQQIMKQIRVEHGGRITFDEFQVVCKRAVQGWKTRA